MKLWKQALAALAALSLLATSCKEDNPDEPKIDPIDWGTVKIADVLNAEAGSTFTLQALVVGANTQGVILGQDGDSYIYAYYGAEHGLAVGDLVNVSGTTTTYNGLLQFAKGCTLEKTGTAKVTYPTPETFTATEIDAYMSAPVIKYVQYDGTVLKSGNYVNVEIDGTSNIGSLNYMTTEFIEKYDHHNVTIKGWLFGSYKTYLYTCPVEVTDKGEFEEDVPEGAIYYNTFDKEIAAQDTEKYGTTKGWPWLDQFDGWKNEKGSGVANVSYSFSNMSCRSNQPSKGDLSLYEGSGNNNLFFSSTPNYFVIEKIAVSSQNLKLSFGAQRYSQGAANTFIKSDFEVRVSADGELWSQKLSYDFNGVEDDPGQWRYASADFTLPAGTTTLYIKFVGQLASVFRLDDVLLAPGNGGEQIEFGKDESLSTSTIATVIASPVDAEYKIEGQVVGTHTKGFLVKDATGTILVFKKSHGCKVGDKVTVEGATTEYGGMKQFGETSTVTVSGNETFTQPTAETFDAAKITAYVNDPVIKYVTVEGALSTSVVNYQTYYNVTTDGTSVITSVAYPNSELGISKYVNRNVKVTGYTIGTTGTDTKYMTLLAISVAPTEEETPIDESQAITVKELNAKLADMKDGDLFSKAGIVAVKGYIAANNENGTMTQIVSLVDNDGSANSGIIIKGTNYTEATLPVGTKVLVDLRYAEYDVYKNLPQVLKAEITSLNEKATIKVPDITISQSADYYGQYVNVKNVTPPSTATTWVVGNANTSIKFTDADGKELIAYIKKAATFGSLTIAQKTADLKGVMIVYGTDFEIYPTSAADVAGFTE